MSGLLSAKKCITIWCPLWMLDCLEAVRERDGNPRVHHVRTAINQYIREQLSPDVIRDIQSKYLGGEYER